MTTATEPLREEHKELIPHIEALLAAADAIDTDSADALRAKVDDSYAFLIHGLIPHAQAEERALYPVIGRLLGAPEATGTMSRDHVEVMRLTDQLRDARKQLDGPAPADVDADLRRILYGLYALVHVHFAKEEEVYLPILDRGLSPEDARKMFEAMEAAAAEAKAEARARAA
ncbi:MAG TPA: hemerythrin domain-containing protein [Dehalococcoidia bacterium]|nr:hemerythrin domain-containing protein [Dehalococcoidia bacterium]